MNKNLSLSLNTAYIQNFKAVRDSGLVVFTPLTVFIGNNGTGKSSLIESLETLQSIVLNGLDSAFETWHGMEQVWNQAVTHEEIDGQDGNSIISNPMTFDLQCTSHLLPLFPSFSCQVSITSTKKHNEVFFSSYKANLDSSTLWDKFTIKDPQLINIVKSWQFLDLQPTAMLHPRPQKRSIQEVRLIRDGSNIAQYLQSLYDIEPGILSGIVDTLKSVLPYAEDLRPTLTQEIERNFYLRLQEQGIKEALPSWLLSQGTLRIVALLAVLRHPKPPSVVFIEELENGLDPRTLHLLVDEIRSFIEDGGQVVATTHSPYLLDLLDLSQIIVVERNKSGAPTFTRPSKRKLKGWAEKFSPGRLYTMGNLTKDNK